MNASSTIYGRSVCKNTMCYVVAQIGLDLENSLGLEGKAPRTQDTSRGSVTTTFDDVKPNLSVEVVPILKH